MTEFQIEYLPVHYAMNDYNLSERDIAEAAIKGKLQLFIYDGTRHTPENQRLTGDDGRECNLNFFREYFYVFDLHKVNQFFYNREVKIIKEFASIIASMDKTAQPPPDFYTKENICVNIPELEAAFSIINPKTAPPLLALAIQSWVELFSGTFPATGGVTIKSVINEHIAIKYDKKLDQGQIPLIVSIISPSDINPAQHIQTDSNLLDKMNKPGHKFYAKELATAVEIWHKIQPGRDERLPNKKALRKELNRLKNKKKSNFSNPAIERIETILTIV